MEKILRIPFTEIDTADLLVDAVYEGGTAKNLGSEVLSKVMHVGNSGGFRKCMKLGENGKRRKMWPMYVFIQLERKSNGVMKSIERLDVLHTGEITEKPAIR